MTRFDAECWICEAQETICMGGGGSDPAPAGNTTTVQKSDPWAGQQPYLTTGFQQAQQLYDTGGPQYFPGQTYAPSTDAQNTAIAGQEQLGANGSPIAGASQNAAMNILNPDFLNSNPGNAGYQQLSSGPAVQDAINSAVSKATPGLMDAFTQGNRMNSPGAAYAVSQGITSAAAPYVLAGMQQGAQGLSQNYATAAQQQNQANLIAPQTQNLAYNDLSNLYNAGQQQQTLSQQGINDQLARYNYGQTQPFNLLNWYNAGVGGSYGATSTLTSPYFTAPTGGIGGALTGAAAGASLGGSLFNSPYAGGALGGLLGGLS